MRGNECNRDKWAERARRLKPAVTSSAHFIGLVAVFAAPPVWSRHFRSFEAAQTVGSTTSHSTPQRHRQRAGSPSPNSTPFEYGSE